MFLLFFAQKPKKYLHTCKKSCTFAHFFKQKGLSGKSGHKLAKRLWTEEEEVRAV